MIYFHNAILLGTLYSIRSRSCAHSLAHPIRCKFHRYRLMLNTHCVFSHISRNGNEMAKFNKRVWISNEISLNNWILDTHTHIHTVIVVCNVHTCVHERVFVNMIKLRFDFMLLCLFTIHGVESHCVVDGIQSKSVLRSWITKSPRDYDTMLFRLLLLLLLIWMASGMILSAIFVCFLSK